MYRLAMLSVVLMTVALCAAIAQPSTQPQELPEMAAQEFRVASIALAVENLEPTVRFYEKVFNAVFEPLEGTDRKIYAGKLLGFDFLLASNELAGVNAEQSRHQFDIVVNDLDSVLQRVTEAGGTIREQQTDRGVRTVTIVDPDGNTMLFIGNE